MVVKTHLFTVFNKLELLFKLKIDILNVQHHFPLSCFALLFWGDRMNSKHHRECRN